MIVQTIGWYCILHAILCGLVLVTSLKNKDKIVDGPKTITRAHFLIIGYLAVAAWCFK